MRAQLITGAIAAVGFLLVVIGGAMLASQFRFRRQAGTVQGTITALRAVPAGGPGAGVSGLVYRPTVRFTTAEGKPVEAESRTGANPAPGQVGKVVIVHYDPADPSRFSLTTRARAPGCIAWALILLGGLVFVVAALVLAAIA